MHNKKAVIISSEFPPGPGGIGKHAYDLAKVLSWKGYLVTVFASQDFSSESEIETFNETLKSEMRICRFKRSGFSTYINRWKLVENYVVQNSPDKIIVTGRFSLWIGYFLKLKYKNKIQIHAFIHGSELSNKNKLNYFLTKQSLNKLDFLWAVSTFTQTQLINSVNRKDVRVLPNGLWLDDWNGIESQNNKLPLKGSPSLLTVGRISTRKGQHRVINALPFIKKQYPEIHYHTAGIDDNKKLIVDKATNLSVIELLSIHGKIQSGDDLARLYKGSDIFIMLSENQKNGDVEGFGIAILEANFFGKPAIGAKGCGIEDAITDGYNGRLVDGNNPSEIILAIEDILNNYTDYSLRAKNWALNHSWKTLIENFEKKEDYKETDKMNFAK